MMISSAFETRWFRQHLRRWRILVSGHYATLNVQEGIHNLKVQMSRFRSEISHSCEDGSKITLRSKPMNNLMKREKTLIWFDQEFDQEFYMLSDPPKRTNYDIWNFIMIFWVSFWRERDRGQLQRHSHVPQSKRQFPSSCSIIVFRCPVVCQYFAMLHRPTRHHILQRMIF